MFELQTIIIVLKVVTLAAGGFVTLLAWRAYARTESAGLRALAVGLGLVTVGGFLAGAVHQLTTLDIVAGIAIQSSFTAVGFAVLAYSLYVREADTQTEVRGPLRGDEIP